ncbi:MAG: hypothetical protein ACYTHM_17160 [Planctomycetota bacterium]|jgi:hypothetical protein
MIVKSEWPRLGILAVYFSALMSTFLVAPAEAGKDVIWDMGLLERFDRTHEAYPIVDGEVTVDLRKKKDRCPVGLGPLVGGRERVKGIVILYAVRKAGDAWLHLWWSPGGSGKEQIEVTLDGGEGQKSDVVDGAKRPYIPVRWALLLNHRAGEHVLRLRHLSGDGLRLKRLTLARTEEKKRLPQTLRPVLKFPTLTSYEKEIKEKGVVLDSEHVRIFAPWKRAKEARIVGNLLERAYRELVRIVGMHTQYKIVVYHFPKDHPDFSGGTSRCTIWYGYGNLDFDAQPEWKQHKVPHVSGYIEEMSHNFAPLVTFGWEMVGWHGGRIVTEKVAANPTNRKHVESTREAQAKTFREYRKLGNVVPPDLPNNLSDRIHGHLLWECERRYGPRFWHDFYAEVRTIYRQLEEAACVADSDERRNQRYRLTLGCFERLDKKRRLLDPRRDFKTMLSEYGISLTKALKSLHPTDEGWNRKLE